MIIVKAYYNEKMEKVKYLEDAVMVELLDTKEAHGGQLPVSDLPYLLPYMEDEDEDGYTAPSLEALGYKG